MMMGLLFCLPACQSSATFPPDNMMIAHLNGKDPLALTAIQEAFARRNPGYSLQYQPSLTSLPAEAFHRILFVQEGWPEVRLSNGQSAKSTVGDIIVLAAGESLEADSLMSVLSFQVPTLPDETVPSVIRPDWDPNITDIPGGCATDSNAYRRILLTWKQEVGQYLYHDLNAHRVRIMNSFSHYHPVEGGFDEFYLVQMALPDARILTSERVDKITHPASVKTEDLDGMIQSTSLAVGDLVYLPRGVMHRGLGGVLAQVITVPGFIPGAEIGVDHHLKAINDRLSLSGENRLPFNAEAADKPVIK